MSSNNFHGIGRRRGGAPKDLRTRSDYRQAPAPKDARQFGTATGLKNEGKKIGGCREEYFISLGVSQGEETTKLTAPKWSGVGENVCGKPHPLGSCCWCIVRIGGGGVLSSICGPNQKFY